MARKTFPPTTTFWLPVLLGILLIVLVLAPLHASAQATDPDLPSYVGWIREAQAAARRGDRLSLEDISGRLIQTKHIRLSTGASLAVDNGWLRIELARPTRDTTLIVARLGAIADSLAQPANTAPSDALSRLRAILDAPPYSRPAPTPPPRWLTDFLGWLGRIIEAILQPLGAVAPGTANVVAWAIGLIGLAALIGVIAYLIRGLTRGIVADAKPASGNPEEHLTAREALDQAGSLARDGDYRTGVRFLYLAALLRLDERGLLNYDRALTNREYLERLRDNPRLRTALLPIVETFDRVWYGHLPIDALAFSTYRAQVEQLGRES
jgi:hypothetical protein